MATSPITFEANNLAEFDATDTDGGELSTSGAAAMHGSYGMQANINLADVDDKYGTITYANKTRLRVGFYFDPNNITMADADTIFLAGGGAVVGGDDWRIYFRYLIASGYQLSVWVTTDGGQVFSPWVNLSDGVHWLEVDLKRSTGANDGFAKLWIDFVHGTPDTESLNIDDDTRDYDNISVGAGSVDNTIDGTLYFDYITWNDDGTPLGPPPTPAGFGYVF